MTDKTEKSEPAVTPPEVREGPDSEVISEAQETQERAASEPAIEAPKAAALPAQERAAWGEPIARFEHQWVKLETWLAVSVLIAEVVSLCAWVFLKGLSTPSSANVGGVVLRAAITSTVLGAVVWIALRKQPERFRSTATTIAAAVGLFLGRAWANVGVDYGSELLNWYQDASSLTLIGGLRGVGTRLTAWLAMLGASLATSSGKHINIDVIMRFIPVKARVPAAIAASLAAAIVCFTATWGFVDHIALANFGAEKTATPTEKVGVITHELGEHAFVLRKQIGLDMTVGFRVLFGAKYTKALTGAEWNAHIRDGGYEAWYKPEEVKSLLVPADMESDYVAPLVIVPGKTQRGLLVDGLNLLFPFGFFMIGLKFLLRALQVASGHVVVDPDAMHREEEIEQAHKPGTEAALWAHCSS